MPTGITSALVPVTSAEVDEASDPAQYVVIACQRAKAWLADALDHGDIDQIVELKSQAEAIRVYTLQKQLGKDAELSAAEIVRRAERGIGLAIRKAQEAGEVATPAMAKAYAGRVRQQKDRNLVLRPKLPSDIVSQDELTANGAGIYHLTDGVSDQQFEAAIDEAKSEGNLSRANVVRKVQATTVPPADRVDVIADLAGQGYSSRQIAARLGIGDGKVREIARQHNVAIPADAAIGRTRKTDSTRIVRETVHALEGLAIGVDLVNVNDITDPDIENWVTSLTTSIRVLNRLVKQMKEMTQ